MSMPTEERCLLSLVHLLCRSLQKRRQDVSHCRLRQMGRSLRVVITLRFLDDGEAVYHKTSDCAKRHAARVGLIKEILPCGVCRAIANADSAVYLSKYGDKYHSMDCKHVQQKNFHIHSLTPCSECWSGTRFLE